jgi:hypothetical protein
MIYAELLLHVQIIKAMSVHSTAMGVQFHALKALSALCYDTAGSSSSSSSSSSSDVINDVACAAVAAAGGVAAVVHACAQMSAAPSQQHSSEAVAAGAAVCSALSCSSAAPVCTLQVSCDPVTPFRHDFILSVTQNQHDTEYM